MDSSPALELVEVSKRYGATIALREASFRVARGSVHGLIGENGAGKSTIVKVLSGVEQADGGSISVAGKATRIRSSRDALDAGVATAFQELTLVPYLTVAQNLLLGRGPRNRFGLISNNRLAERGAEILAAFELSDVDPNAQVVSLGLAVRQQLELVRALSRDSEVLLLDEPTAALGAVQVDWLFGQVQNVRDRGGTIVFISHRMGEVRAICDWVTVLRSGHEVNTFATDEASDSQVIEMMIGHELERALAETPTERTVGRPVLGVFNLASDVNLTDASLVLHEGEILGVAALQGHGQLELFMSLFGARRPVSGRIEIDDRPVRVRSPHDAVGLGFGISLVPEDRKAEGVMLGMSGLRNVTLPVLSKFSKMGFINKRAERAAAARLFRSLDVKLTALDDEVSTLSGGNQQKLAIGKWILGDSRIMLMYDPTRGVDVGTKAEIYSLMTKMADAGRAILLYSTDIEELVAITSNILVLYRGQVVAQLTGRECTRNAVLSLMLGERADSFEPGEVNVS